MSLHRIDFNAGFTEHLAALGIATGLHGAADGAWTLKQVQGDVRFADKPHVTSPNPECARKYRS